MHMLLRSAAIAIMLLLPLVLLVYQRGLQKEASSHHACSMNYSPLRVRYGE
jgi:hypothetical protein